MVGREDKLPTDDGGYLIAKKFKGSGDLDNLVPMDSILNRSGGNWYKMEQELDEALRDGAEVFIYIDLVYEGSSKRPNKFIVKHIIDGYITNVIWR
ncbi:MAG: DNA/RNA non-specific endonuclease [Anaerofustis sp.]